MKEFAYLICLLHSVSALAQPYEPTIIWDRSGETDSAAYGYRILPLGDQNDDGYADWAVLANGNVATWHGTRATYLEFFHGSLDPSTEPAFVLRQDSTVYYQTWYATEAGDLNGDGYVDWYISYSPRESPLAATYHFFFGGQGFSSEPDMLWPSVTGFYRMQDFNGDGFDDLYSYGVENIGRMYFGGNPMDTIPDWVLYQPPPGLIQSIPYAVGDFNGDGASDFMCFQSGSGNVAVFIGGADPDTVPAYFWNNMTRPHGGMDSLNGDVADEFVRGAPGGNHAHFGRPQLSPVPDAFLNSIAPVYAANGKDFNNDGYNDLIMYTWSTVSNPFGALDLHLGGTWLYPDPAFVIQGDTPPLFLRGIYTAAGLGDVNGNGNGDIAIGVFHDTFFWRGRCVILAGDDSLIASGNGGRAELPQEFEVSVFPNPFNSTATVRLILPWSNQLNEVEIYNLLGQLVRRDTLPPFVREFTYHFRAEELPSGVYFLHVRSGSQFKTKKLMLLR